MDYTKGPWTWNNFHDAHTALIRTAELKPGDKRTVLYHAAEWEMLPADKNLIQAAPDMYEALKEVEYSAVLDLDGDFISCCPICDVWAGEKHKDYCEIGNALRKAEGRTI